MATLIMFNLTIVARLVQCTHPVKIKWSNIRSLEQAEYFDYRVIKALFAAMILDNVLMVARYEDYRLGVLWLPNIWWWKFFTNKRFEVCMLLSVLSIVGYALLLKMYYYVNIVWSTYTFYLAFWYKYYSFVIVMEV